MRHACPIGEILKGDVKESLLDLRGRLPYVLNENDFRAMKIATCLQLHHVFVCGNLAAGCRVRDSAFIVAGLESREVLETFDSHLTLMTRMLDHAPLGAWREGRRREAKIFAQSLDWSELRFVTEQ